MTESCDDYHRWYVEAGATVKFMDVWVMKWIGDLWNYQELISDLKPSLIVEAGTRAGGGALFFAEMARAAHLGCLVLTVDPEQSGIHNKVRAHPGIELLAVRSTNPVVAERIEQVRQTLLGPMLVSLDSDHTKANVLAEMLFFRDLTRSGDYMVVEDGNINGHPVLPGWGEGPYEALQEYAALYPDDYERDIEREEKFGMTYAPLGYLKRR